VILAELEVYHSRPVAPTRRVALGERRLPVAPAPGFGGILLGGVVAAHLPLIDPDLVGDLWRLSLQLEHGHRIAQPRLRHRLQTDRIGLTLSTLRLRGEGDRMGFDFEEKAAPAQYVLAAVYAAGEVDPAVRPAVLDAVRRGLDWIGPVGPELIGHLAGTGGPSSWSAAAFADPVGWALLVLDMEADGTSPDRTRVQSRFRRLLRDAHPDHGGGADAAPQRIADLTAARRILLTSP
jgi:hypothetical protein